MTFGRKMEKKVRKQVFFDKIRHVFSSIETCLDYKHNVFR